MNPQIQLLIVQERHRNLRREAEAERLAALHRRSLIAHRESRADPASYSGLPFKVVRRFVARFAGA
jgi:hypothetical protein